MRSLEHVREIQTWTRETSQWRDLVEDDLHYRNAIDTVVETEIEVRRGTRDRLELTLGYLCERADRRGLLVTAARFQPKAQGISRRLCAYQPGGMVAIDEMVEEATDIEALAMIVAQYQPALSEFIRHLGARVAHRTLSAIAKRTRRRNVAQRFFPVLLAADLRKELRTDPSQLFDTSAQLGLVRERLGEDAYNWLVAYIENEEQQVRTDRERQRAARLRATAREVQRDD
jgi:hypothetical protein